MISAAALVLTIVGMGSGFYVHMETRHANKEVIQNRIVVAEINAQEGLIEYQLDDILDKLNDLYDKERTGSLTPYDNRRLKDLKKKQDRLYKKKDYLDKLRINSS